MVLITLTGGTVHMAELIAAIRDLAAKVKSGSADVWDYLELVYRITSALLSIAILN